MVFFYLCNKSFFPSAIILLQCTFWAKHADMDCELYVRRTSHLFEVEVESSLTFLQVRCEYQKSTKNV